MCILLATGFRWCGILPPKLHVKVMCSNAIRRLSLCRGLNSEIAQDAAVTCAELKALVPIAFVCLVKTLDS